MRGRGLVVRVRRRVRVHIWLMLVGMLVWVREGRRCAEACLAGMEGRKDVWCGA